MSCHQNIVYIIRETKLILSQKFKYQWDFIDKCFSRFSPLSMMSISVQEIIFVTGLAKVDYYNEALD